MLATYIRPPVPLNMHFGLKFCSLGSKMGSKTPKKWVIGPSHAGSRGISCMYHAAQSRRQFTRYVTRETEVGQSRGGMVARAAWSMHLSLL